MDLFVWDSYCFLDLDVAFVPRLGKFTAIIVSNKFFASLFFLFSPSGTPVMQILVHLMSWSSLKQSSFLKILFAFCVVSRWLPLPYLPGHSLFLSFNMLLIPSYLLYFIYWVFQLWLVQSYTVEILTSPVFLLSLMSIFMPITLNCFRY